MKNVYMQRMSSFFAFAIALPCLAPVLFAQDFFYTSLNFYLFYDVTFKNGVGYF